MNDLRDTIEQAARVLKAYEEAAEKYGQTAEQYGGQVQDYRFAKAILALSTGASDSLCGPVHSGVGPTHSNDAPTLSASVAGADRTAENLLREARRWWDTHRAAAGEFDRMRTAPSAGG